MAKSIRSKRKRMFRNIKRQRYAVKEMIRLKKMLGLAVTETEAAVPPRNVIEYSLKTKPDVKEEPLDDKVCASYSFSSKGVLILESSDEEEMNAESEGEPNSTMGEKEMDHSQKLVYDRKTKKDQFGKYPAWFRQKDMKKQAKKDKLRQKILQKQKKLKEIAETKKNKRKMRKKKKKNLNTEEQSSSVEQGGDEKQSIKMEQNSSEEPSTTKETNSDVV